MLQALEERSKIKDQSRRRIERRRQRSLDPQDRRERFEPAAFGHRDRGQACRSWFRFADVRRAAGGGRGRRRPRSLAGYAERGSDRSRAADRGSTCRQIEETCRRAASRREERRGRDRTFPSIVRRVGNALVDFATDTLYDRRSRHADRGRSERAAARQFYRRAESHVAYRHRAW